MKKYLVVGLDIGTTKICTLIAKIKEGRDFEVVGIGKAPSRGLNKGVVTNIKKTSQVIKNSLKRAEFDAGLKIKEAWVSIAGAHIQGRDNRGFTKIEKKKRVITAKDVESVLEDASHLVLPPNREIIHVLPQEFLIDDQDEIKDPIGMRGARLEAKVHIVTASSSHRRNIENSLRQAGYEPEGVVLQSLASGMATLSPEEQNLGVVLLDIGGGTTDLAIFLKEGIRFTRVLGVGGNHITNDIAIGLHTTRPKAEEIKIKYGSALVDSLEMDEEIQVERVAERGTYRIKKEVLVRIIQMRVEEILELANKELKKSGYKDLITAGTVITGGCSLLRGIKEKAEEKLGLPARIGYPRISKLGELNSPIYATAIGLILYGIKERERLASRDKLGVRIKEWIKDFF
ncbi:MAG: cell division protein FtsA [Candidatus Aerophobetes bacterium]|nr:cell division protein FtsA [Candidatus Aerophobetes bacterium]